MKILTSFFIAYLCFYSLPACADQKDQTAPDNVTASQASKNQSEVSQEQEQLAAKEVARLIEMVKLPSRDRALTNWDILQALIKIGKPAVASLISDMEKADPVTMAISMYSLGMIGDTRAIMPLYNLLPPVEDEAEAGPTSTKASICFTLAALGDVNSIPLVMQGPYAANRTIGGGTISYIGAIATMLGGKSVVSLIEIIEKYKDDKKAYGAITALGKVADERAIPFLKTLLEHQDDTVKALAIDALAQIGDPSTSEAIIPFLDYKVDIVREAAAESMRNLRDRHAIKKLCTIALNDTNSQVRLKAIFSLGTYGGNEGFNVLLKATEDSDVIVRTAATEWLGKSGNKKAEMTLKKKIKDRDSRVGLRAVDAYDTLMGKKAEEFLLNVLNDTRWTIQRESIRALTRLNSKKAAIPVISVLRDAIDQGDKNRDYNNIILETLKTLSEIGDEKLIDTLKEFSKRVNDPEMKKLFNGALHDISLKVANGTDVNKWIKSIEEGDAGDKSVAIDMLGKIGDTSAVKILIEEFGKMDVDISSSIPKALGKIKAPSAIAFLEDLLTNSMFDEKKIYPARVNAAWALGECKSTTSLRPLKECLFKYDGEPFSAIVAIVKIAGKDSVPDLCNIKARLMRSPSYERMQQYNNVNWLIRNLKNDWSISSLDEEP